MANLRIARVTVSALAASPPPISAAASAPASQFYLFHNWDAPSVLETAFSTDVTASSASVSEERRALVDRPYKTQQCLLTNLTRSEATRALYLLLRAAQEPTLVPVYSSVTFMTGAPSGAVVPCDTRYRRFAPGVRVLLYNPVSEVVEDAVISSMTHTTMTLTGSPSGTFAEGSRVYPLMDCEVIQNASKTLLTDGLSEVDVQFQELQGPTALPPLDLWYPSGRPAFSGIPFLNSYPNWAKGVSIEVQQPGQVSEFGRGTIARIRGVRPKLLFRFYLTALSREEAWDHLRFFDACMGRLRTFWLQNPLVMFEPVADVETTHADVLAMAPDDFEVAADEFTTHLMIEEFDGTLTLATVSGATDASGVTRFAFSPSLAGTISQADIKSITSVHKCRFYTDNMVETWLTDEVCDLQFQVIEVLEETAASVTNLADSLAAAGFEGVGSKGGPFWWLSLSKNVYENASPIVLADPGSPNGDGDEILRVFDARESTPASGTPNSVRPILVNTFPSGSILLHKLSDSTVARGRLSAHFPAANVEYCKLDSLAVPLEDSWFDNTDGFTMFVVVNDLADSVDFFEQVGVLEWSESSCDVFPLLNIVSASGSVSYTAQTVPSNAVGIFVLRWDPGVSMRVFKNGVQLAAAASPISGFPTGGGDMRVTGDDCKILEHLMYQEALSLADLNEVGNLLASLYNTTWETVT